MIFVVRILCLFVALVVDTALSGFLGKSFMWVDVTLMLVVTWALLLGFSESLGWTILAGLLFDLVFFERVGYSILFFTVSAYGVSFLSKRFFAGHIFRLLLPYTGLLVFLFFVKGGVLFFGDGSGQIFEYMVVYGGVSFVWHFVVFVAGALLFLGVYYGISRLESFFSYYSRSMLPK